MPDTKNAHGKRSEDDRSTRREGELRRRVAEVDASERARLDWEARFRALAGGIPDAVCCLFDRELRLIHVGGHGLVDVGLTPQTVGRKVAEVLAPEALRVVEPQLRRVFEGETGAHTLEFRGRVFEIHPLPIAHGAGPATEGLAIVFDVSDRRLLEEQIRQTQKMEAIGQLAGGVAHDFNNILTAVLGNVELVRSALEGRLDPDDPLHEGLEQIERAGQRAAVLTRQLLTFSRRQVLRPEVLDPAQLLADMTRLLRRLLRENVQLEVVCPPQVGRFRADIGQMEQVIINLVVNARDAMPEGGLLTISAEGVDLGVADVEAYPDARTGRHVVFHVKDTGCGMNAATVRRVFEPFFTTKEAGPGTGLGLATVHSVVRQMRGHIRVESALGRGSTFSVYVPAVDARVADGPEALVVPPRGGHETVLVCEDDFVVRQLTCQTLMDHGYEVLAAQDADEALAAAGAHPGRLHLLVTDVIMPGRNGRQLAAALAAGRQDLKVLFVSGYPADVVSRHGILDAGVHFLEKPYSSRELLRRVREVLDAGG